MFLTTGTIDNNSEKNTYLGFTYSVALHALLILLYFCFRTDDSSKRTQGRIFSSIELDSWLPAPEVSRPGFSATKYSGALRPDVGIPMPVPDVEVRTQSIEPLNTITSISSFGSDTGTGIQGNAFNVSSSSSVNTIGTSQNRAETHPDKDSFINVSEEAHPIQNIENVVRYPETARHGNLEGKVLYSALIGKNGKVLSVDIEKADYEVFKQPVIDALMNTRFTPALQGDIPVEVWYSGTVSFRLSR